MDELLAVAVAGTARASGKSGFPAAPIDRALAQLDAHRAERRLLLTAGAYSLRRRAGVLPLTHPDAADIAGDESWDVAPERVALLIGELISGRAADVLPEALERLQRARLRIPPAMLPAALDAGTRSKAIRSGLLAVVGERGHWLARHNSAWSWATEPDDDEITANADTIWQEGKQAERLAVLRLVRSSDPSLGLAMLESTWKRERSTFRAEALDILNTNLSPADQPFLEAALEDKAQPVRERAEALLTRIPGSLPAREAVAKTAPLIGKRLGFQIVIRPPDGDASTGSDRAAAMSEAISQVPPSHWTNQLGKSPADLIKTAVRDRDWGFAVLEGFTRAAVTFGDAEWAEALWPVWLSSPPQPGMAAKTYVGSFDAIGHRHLIALLQVMRPGDAAQVVANVLSGSFDPTRISVVLPHLTQPWSTAFTDRYLRSFRDQAETTLKQAQVNWNAFNAWALSFQTAALAIPAGSIQSAVVLLSQLLDVESRHGTDYRLEYWKQLLRQSIDTLRMRQRIIEEIPG